uniref:Neuronal pentraxin 1 n=1 Tax=Strigops habroptila TaxID=2489341 RepID=A0A672UQT7_STRHB
MAAGLLLLPLLLPLLPPPGRGQGFGQTRFVCTSVPLDGDMCAAAALGTGSAEELKSTVLQLRETVLQQKETIMNQKETIRELTAKLGRCESQSAAEPPPGDGKGRKLSVSKNTMGDLSRTPAAETLSQLGQTLQSLKTRLENLEQFSRMNSSSQTNNLKDILQNKIDDLEKQVLSRVNSLEEGKFNPRNESEERGKIESTLTSLHQRISDLEKGQKDNRPPDRFQLTFPLRTNYMYAKVKKSLPEMYAFSVCMWMKSNASPGMGTPFSYAVPGQANELVLIEWGNNPMEILINDKVQPWGGCWVGGEPVRGQCGGDPYAHHPDPLPVGGQTALCHQRWQVAPHLCHLDHAGRRVGSLPGWHTDRQRREPGTLPPHQTPGGPGAGPGAGKGLGGGVPALLGAPEGMDGALGARR